MSDEPVTELICQFRVVNELFKRLSGLWGCAEIRKYGRFLIGANIGRTAVCAGKVYVGIIELKRHLLWVNPLGSCWLSGGGCGMCNAVVLWGLFINFERLLDHVGNECVVDYNMHEDFAG